MLMCDREIAELNQCCCSNMLIQFKRTLLRYVLDKVDGMFIYELSITLTSLIGLELFFCFA